MTEEKTEQAPVEVPYWEVTKDGRVLIEGVQVDQIAPPESEKEQAPVPNPDNAQVEGDEPEEEEPEPEAP